MKYAIPLSAALGLALGSLHAQTVPLFINYQGKVTDSNGVGLGTGTPVNRKVIFRLWNHPSDAAAANRLWTEEQTVTIFNGEFSVLLGQGINPTGTASTETRGPLEAVFTSGGAVTPSGPLRYLEIMVDNGDNIINATDAAITPRQQITTTAYSFRARTADTVAGSSIDATALAANSVTSAKLADNSINNFKIEDGAVNTAKIADASINSAKIQDLSVGTADLADGSVITSKLSNNAVTTAKIADSSITSGKIADGSVIGSDMAANSIDSSKIVDGTISGADLANNAVTLAKLDASTIGLWTASGANAYRASGNVGIGTTAPGFPLNFANVLGAKISLWGNAGNSFGFGIQNSLLQIHTDGSSSDIAFGHGSSAAMTETMRIKGNGNVGIGTNNPLDKFHVAGVGGPNLSLGPAASAFRLDDGAGRFVRMYRSLRGFVIQGNLMDQVGNQTAYIQWDGDGNWDQSSDRKLKKDIVDAEPVLGRLMQLPVRRYHWKDRPAGVPKSFGVVAQEVQPLFPDVVGSMLREEDTEETMTVKYASFGLIAAKAVQELKQEKDAELNALREENTALRDRLSQLEADGEARDTKLEALEKLVLSIEPPANRTVSLKAR